MVSRARGLRWPHGIDACCSGTDFVWVNPACFWEGLDCSFPLPKKINWLNARVYHWVRYPAGAKHEPAREKKKRVRLGASKKKQGVARMAGSFPYGGRIQSCSAQEGLRAPGTRLSVVCQRHKTGSKERHPPYHVPQSSKNSEGLIFWDSELSSLQTERASIIILLCVTQICINISSSRAATRKV